MNLYSYCLNNPVNYYYYIGLHRDEIKQYNCVDISPKKNTEHTNSNDNIKNDKVVDNSNQYSNIIVNDGIIQIVTPDYGYSNEQEISYEIANQLYDYSKQHFSMGSERFEYRVFFLEEFWIITRYK